MYTPWSVTAGEVPTTAKWNILGDNDESFNDGTGIADNAIITRHLNAASVTNAKTNFTAPADASGSLTLGSGVTTTDVYLIKVNNLVILTGFFDKSTFSSGDTVCTLPVGYRPVAGIIRAAAFVTSAADVGRVEVSTPGTVIYRGAASKTNLIFQLVFMAA
jgi:hypothetical protein